jgi:tetratricopeptide (TPR) repeat protein
VKYPNANKVRMEAYFAYVICRQVLADARLSPGEKAQLAVSLLPQDPGNAQLRQNAMSAIAAGNYDRAEALAAAAEDQVAAVLLIEDGHPDLAIQNLRESERLLDGRRSGDTAQDRLQRGYNYKTYAQAFGAKGDTTNELRYLGLALDTFNQVKDDPALNEKTTTEFAGAIHGIGNIHHQIGLYREAIADYRRAVDLLPNYAYAWYDMFLAYYELAKQGDIDLPAMRMALGKTKETGAGVPGLDTTEIAQLESMLAEYEKQKLPDRNMK